MCCTAVAVLAPFPFGRHGDFIVCIDQQKNMRTASCKNKGRRLQQWLCKLLAEELAIDPEDCRSCSMGAGGEDVILSKAARAVFPYSVECKNREAHNVWGSYTQCVKNAKGGHEPLVCMKRNKSRPLIVVDAAHFVGLVARATPPS